LDSEIYSDLILDLEVNWVVFNAWHTSKTIKPASETTVVVFLSVLGGLEAFAHIAMIAQ
jgi:hypothetical protein